MEGDCNFAARQQQGDPPGDATATNDNESLIKRRPTQ
uniref:Uncharacterized protein n=1 Tax=Fagus sylvatica TaxID=28930 RepID=A0A2N9HW95_FAGSY